MLGKISDGMVDKLYNTAIEIFLELKRKDMADGLENLINLMDEKLDTNLNKVHEIIDVLKNSLPPEG